MSHIHIKKLHQFVCESERLEEYRSDGHEVRVSAIDKNTGKEIVYWHGAQSEDVKKFMDDYIQFYKSNSLSLLNSNPFLKSAMSSLLFIRIHPFLDGNGRTARMLHNIKFTESVNKIYNTKLKLCPLNISRGILMYKPTYVKRIDDIYFDLEHDSNDEINAWLDFMLNRVDDEIYFSNQKLPQLEQAFKNISAMKSTDSSDLVERATKMNFQKVKK